MTGSEKFAKLQTLRDKAGQGHYDRISLADELLKDRGWVRAVDGGGGNEDKAITRLEDTCFADLCGIVGLPQLLEIYHQIPDFETWKKYKFNFRKMWAEFKAKQKPEKPNYSATYAVSKGILPPNEFAQATPRTQINEYQKVFVKYEQKEKKLVHREEENRLLREENRLVKEENRMLRKMAGVPLNQAVSA